MLSEGEDQDEKAHTSDDANSYEALKLQENTDKIVSKCSTSRATEVALADFFDLLNIEEDDEVRGRVAKFRNKQKSVPFLRLPYGCLHKLRDLTNLNPNIRLGGGSSTVSLSTVPPPPSNSSDEIVALYYCLTEVAQLAKHRGLNEALFKKEAGETFNSNLKGYDGMLQPFATAVQLHHAKHFPNGPLDTDAQPTTPFSDRFSLVAVNAFLLYSDKMDPKKGERLYNVVFRKRGIEDGGAGET